MARNRYGNVAEQSLVDRMRRSDIEPNKRGWPDFWFLDEDGVFTVVEVKRGKQPLKRHQEAVLNEFHSLGVPTYVYRYRKSRRGEFVEWEPTGGRAMEGVTAGPERRYGKAQYRH